MKTTLILLLLGIGLSGVHAQILHPVKWGYAVIKTNDKEAMVMLRATIEPEWHIYSSQQAAGGPVKTSFKFIPSKDYTLVGKPSEPKPITKYEDAFSMNVSYFEKEVTFQQKIKLDKPATIIKGTLNFMVCNDKQCLPPETVSFSVPVN